MVLAGTAAASTTWRAAGALLANAAPAACTSTCILLSRALHGINATENDVNTPQSAAAPVVGASTTGVEAELGHAGLLRPKGPLAKLPWEVDMPEKRAAAVLGAHLGVSGLQPGDVLDLNLDEITGRLCARIGRGIRTPCLDCLLLTTYH
jgi:hypothetical protein